MSDPMHETQSRFDPVVPRWRVSIRCALRNLLCIIAISDHILNKGKSQIHQYSAGTKVERKHGLLPVNCRYHTQGPETRTVARKLNDIRSWLFWGGMWRGRETLAVETTRAYRGYWVFLFFCHSWLDTNGVHRSNSQRR